MTETLELFGPDWGDVLRRSRRHVRRRLAFQACIVAALVVVGVASAYALGHPIVDFGRSPRAGLRVVDEFGSMQVVAPRGMAPGVLPHRSRRITSTRIDGKVHTLYVAPTKQGGFCYVWSELSGGCRARRNDPFASHVGTGGLGDGRGVLTVLEGTFFQSAGDRLVVSFEDGATANVPFTWVTAPIDAGFYLYRVPDAHRGAATRATSIALFDKHGALIDRESLSSGRLTRGPVVHVTGFSGLMVPQGGIWAKAKMLFDLRAPNGQRVGLWVMPKRGGGTCFLTNTASGCGIAPNPPIELYFNGDRLCCGVGSGIARVEARFQDGDRVSLYPKEGYLVWPIPAAHYALGHRLVALVGYDASGHVVAHGRVPKPADQRGIYPCTAPKAYGYGVTMCP